MTEVHATSSSGERTYAVPAEVPLLPLRETVLFPHSFMPLAVARESSVRLIDEAIASGKLIGVFTQRDADRRGARPGRSLRRRHADAHPQDVQAARRQPAAHRAGAARGSRSMPWSDDRSRTCAPRSPRPSKTTNDADALEIDALAAQHPDELPAGRLSCRRCCPTTCRRSRPTSPSRAVSPTSSRRACRRSARVVKQEVLETLDIRARMDELESHAHQGAGSARARLEDPVAGPVRGRQGPARVSSCASR